jgi:hypothetical protein
MGSTHEHLEHAEHAQHHAHDPFDKRVAMTMAVVAACLASVTVVGHREHNQTILDQAQAAVYHTQASDMWNFYQAKNIRTHEYNAFAALMSSLNKDALQEEKAKKVKDYWENKARTYEEKDLPKLKKEAEDLAAKAKQYEEKSHQAHARTNFFDGGHLFIDLALVACSIAILTKMRIFWFGGIAICALGVAIALVGFTPLALSLAHHGEHGGGEHGSHPPASTAPQTPGKPGH